MAGFILASVLCLLVTAATGVAAAVDDLKVTDTGRHLAGELPPFLASSALSTPRARRHLLQTPTAAPTYATPTIAPEPTNTEPTAPGSTNTQTTVNGLPDGSTVPTGTGGIDDLVWLGFVVAPGTGDYEATDEGQPKLLINSGGGPAALFRTSGLPFSVDSVGIGNPGGGAPLQITVTQTLPGGVVTPVTFTVQPNTIERLSFIDVVRLDFAFVTTSTRRSLQQTATPTTATFTNVIVSADDTPTAPTDGIVPVLVPALVPTVDEVPSLVPVLVPTVDEVPSLVPALVPTVDEVPSLVPALVPTVDEVPALVPALVPTVDEVPSLVPALVPTVDEVPSLVPALVPTDVPSEVPSLVPAIVPTIVPTDVPSEVPSLVPTIAPTDVPSEVPAVVPAVVPSLVPAAVPTDVPSEVPAVVPALVPAVVPSLVPAAVPTDVPSEAPAVVPALVPAVVPAVAPTAPTAEPTTEPTPEEPTPTPSPTRRPPSPTRTPPASCPSGSYRAPGACKKCVFRNSPFRRFEGDGVECYPPATLSRRSRVCTAANLPAFVRSRSDPQRTVRCIDPTRPRYFISLPIRNSRYTDVRGSSYVDASIRLDGFLAPVGGKSFITQGGNQRIQYVFEDSGRRLLTKPGGVVRLTGVFTRPGDLLDFCFVAYLRVC